MFESEQIKDLEGKYFGLYRAIVANTNDPKHLGRITVYCPSVYGKDEKGGMVESTWVRPALQFIGPDFGIYTIPKSSNKKSRTYVWLMFEMGDPNFPVWIGSPVGEVNSMSTIPRCFKKKPNGADRTTPNIYGIVTPGGHRIELDDDSGSKQIRITHGDNDDCFVILDANRATIKSPSIVFDGDVSVNGNISANNI